VTPEKIACLKQARERLVLKRRAALAGIRTQSSSWLELHSVCRRIARIDKAIGEPIRNDFASYRQPGVPRAAFYGSNLTARPATVAEWKAPAAGDD
jgi:hypothetical protein